MTKITRKIPKPEIKCGQYYQDVSRHGSDSVYIVAQIDDLFSLIDVVTGRTYSKGKEEIEEIFADDQEDFILVSNVEIVLS